MRTSQRYSRTAVSRMEKVRCTIIVHIYHIYTHMRYLYKRCMVKLAFCRRKISSALMQTQLSFILVRSAHNTTVESQCLHMCLWCSRLPNIAAEHRKWRFCKHDSCSYIDGQKTIFVMTASQAVKYGGDVCVAECWLLLIIPSLISVTLFISFFYLLLIDQLVWKERR